jgi:hypothetical protein
MPGTRKNSSRSKRSRTRQPIALPHAATLAPEIRLSRGVQRTLVAGAAVVAAGAAATGAIVMRRRIGELAMRAAADAISAGHSVGTFGRRTGKALGREITELDLTRLLTFVGLKRRPSLLRRLVAPVGVLAALVAAGGSALFLIAPKLRAANDENAPAPENKFARPSIARPSASADPSPVRNSIGSTIGSSIDEIEQGVFHEAK